MSDQPFFYSSSGPHHLKGQRVAMVGGPLDGQHRWILRGLNYLQVSALEGHGIHSVTLATGDNPGPVPGVGIYEKVGNIMLWMGKEG